ncbi:MAG TPA: sugar phosphate nucleotidyltransferase [Actinomycetota bacterium]|nr:sugar phosphate nucleotidyltransferase [Actinomycetota bacterium]
MEARNIQAVIMAGGEGSRLRPLTSNVPKPMLPVANRPLMEHIIELLRTHGITDIVATVQFLSSVIRNYFGDGSDLGVSLSYATEDVPLGTAGSVLGAQDLLSGTFIVVSGDALTDIDIAQVIAFHRDRKAAATLVLKRMNDPLEFGIVMTDDDGRIERFLEKPSWGQVFSDTINTGIYVLEPEIFDLIPPDQPFDFSSELFPMMLDKGLPLYGFVTDAYWTDVGNNEAFLQAQHDALSGQVKVTIPGFELRPSVWVGEDVEIDPTARLEGPLLIGDNSNIGASARVGPFTVIGANTIVGDDALVSHGVVMDRSRVGSFARVTSGIIGRGATLDRGATVEEASVLGDEVVVGAGALIKARVKVYPSKTVEAGAIVTQSIVRERRATRSLFGARGVSGLVNVGITPMTAVRLGMAYGTTLKRGSVVVAGRDGSRAARTLKRALIAGLNSTGVTCHDLELTPMPLTRFFTRSEQASGGVSVRTSPADPEVVEIRLFDGDGADLSEAGQRKIERIFYREDYRRTGPAKLGELEFPARALQQYASGLLGSLNVESIRKRAPKIVVDYAFGPASLIGPSILGRLGCDALAAGAHVDEHRPVLSGEDLDRLLENLSDHVRNSGSDVGVLLEPGGEVAHLVDDRGRIVPHERALLAFLGHEASLSGGTMAVPVSCSWACEEIAARAGASLLRTTTGLPSLMARAQRPDVSFAGNAEGVLIFPRFMPAPDGLMTFCKALELVAAADRPLSDIVDGLPPVHLVTRDVRTPWDLKGAVMRHVASVAGAGKLVLLDGVKIVENDRWSLVIPAPDEPRCRIWAEAPSVPEAEELAEQVAMIVEEVVAGGG